MNFSKWFAFIGFAFLPLLLVACNGGDDTSSTASPTASPTGSPAASPSARSSLTAFERYGVVVGTWLGSWTNNTFGSTGAAMMDISLSEDGTASFTLDLDGSVFGASDPPAKTISGTFDESETKFQVTGDDLFGDLTVTVTPDGSISIEATMIPTPGIDSLTARGTITSEAVNLNYTVTFSDGSTAEGVFELMKQ